MRVILLETDHSHSAELVRLLVAAGNTVDVMKDVASAVASLTARPADAVVIGQSFAREALADVFHRLRSADGQCHHLYGVVVGVNNTPAELAAAFAAGADDYLRRPFSREELLARVGGATRLATLLEQARGDSDESKTQMIGTLGTLAEWRNLDTLVCQELVAMFNAEFQRSAFMKPAAGAKGARLRLSLPGERLDIVFALFADSRSLSALGQILLGGALDAAQERDVLFEMVSLAAGAFKRSLLHTNLEMTMGLATDVAPEQLADAMKGVVATQRSTMTTADVQLSLTVAVMPRENEHIPANKLREGMVLIKPVFSANGVLLVPGGTRITSSTAERVSNVLGSRAVEIAPTAD